MKKLSFCHLLHDQPKIRTAEATAYVGGYISGEIKVAIMLRILAGSSYLDMLMIFCVGKTTVYDAFHEIITWINSTFEFELRGLLESENLVGLQKISEGFAKFSNGQLVGIIGAIDRIAIRIKRPTKHDGMFD